MVGFSRHILSIAMFILLPELCCLTNMTCKDGFRYENSAFFVKNHLAAKICGYYQRQGMVVLSAI